MQLYTLQEEKFHWNLNFAILPMANLLNLNSAYIETFYKSINDSSYKRKFKNQNSLKFNSSYISIL